MPIPKQFQALDAGYAGWTGAEAYAHLMKRLGVYEFREGGLETALTYMLAGGMRYDIKRWAVLIIHGARGTGKTCLLQEILSTYTHSLGHGPREMIITNHNWRPQTWRSLQINMNESSSYLNFENWEARTIIRLMPEKCVTPVIITTLEPEPIPADEARGAYRELWVEGLAEKLPPVYKPEILSARAAVYRLWEEYKKARAPWMPIEEPEVPELMPWHCCAHCAAWCMEEYGKGGRA